MYERLQMLCAAKGMSVSALCMQVTGSKGNLSTWKKGYMRSDYLCQCCDILDVSADYLLGRTEKAALIANQSDLTEVLMKLDIEELIQVRDYAKLLLLKKQSQASPTNQ